ncbi:MAG: MFS transporter [Sandaracinaceae bacterium]
MRGPLTAQRDSALTRMKRDFQGLLGAPRELWIVYAVKFIESIAYFAVVNVLILYLHDDLRFDDETAGALFGSWGTLISILTFAAGFIADAMGQRKSLLIAALVAVVGRSLLVVSDVPAIPLFGLALGTWTVASMKPVMTAAVKTHAPTDVRPFAFSIFYVVMNLGALCAGWMVSALRVGLLGRAIRPADWFGDAAPIASESARAALVDQLLPAFPAPEGAAATDVGVRSFARMATGGRDLDFWTTTDLDLIQDAATAHLAGTPIPAAPFGLSGYEMIFLLAALMSVLSVLLVAAMRTDAEPTPQTPEGAGVGAILKQAAAIGRSLFSEKTFWAYLLFICVLVLVRAIFVHAHSTWPTYMVREFGQATPQAALWSLNPAMIIVLTPVIGTLTSRYSAWSIIMTGSFITAASVLFMVAPEPLEAAARGTLGGAFPELDYRLTAPVLFVMVLSVGEALWSPRLYEYVAFMAPKGREASYMGLTQLPMFAAKPLVGFMSGSLLATYCPEHGERSSGVLWIIVFATTLAGPLLALLFSGVIRGAERQRQKEERAAS